MTPRPPLALVGPTASGKTAASIPVAEALGAEIISIDANQVYRGLDTRTGKPDPEQRRRVPHHLLDVVDPSGPIGVAAFQALATDAVARIREAGRAALLVGGSGLYYRAVVDGLRFPGTDPATRADLDAEGAAVGPEAMYRRLEALDPEAARRIDPRNVRRTIRALEVAALTGRPFSSFARDWDRFDPRAVVAAGIDLPRAVLHARIEHRAAAGLDALLEETRRLLERGFGPFLSSSHVMGYAEAVACLEGRIGADEAVARIVRRDKALARRQLSWFRRDPRIRWLPAREDAAEGLVEDLVAYFRSADRATASVEA